MNRSSATMEVISRTSAGREYRRLVESERELRTRALEAALDARIVEVRIRRGLRVESWWRDRRA